MRAAKLLALMTALIAVIACVLIASTQPQWTHQLRNAYWPFSVELQVHDR